MAMSARRPTRAGGILAACGLADVADQDSARWPHHKGLLSRPEALGAAVGRLVLPPDAVLMQHIRVRGVDLYPSIVLLAWSLARSDEIDLSAIAVKREILQFVIAYCSLDL